MSKPWQNAEGYTDRTAYAAVKHMQKEDREQKRLNELISVLKYIINAAGFDLVNRIELQDRESGKVFK